MERFQACMKGYSSTKRGLGIEEGKYHRTKFVLVSTIYDTSTTSTHLCSSLTSMVNNDGVDYQAAAWVSHSSSQLGCLIKVYLYLVPRAHYYSSYMHLQGFMSLLVRHIRMMYSCLISASPIRDHQESPFYRVSSHESAPPTKASVLYKSQLTCTNCTW
jgi:hypothetical protein